MLTPVKFDGPAPFGMRVEGVMVIHEIVDTPWVAIATTAPTPQGGKEVQIVLPRANVPLLTNLLLEWLKSQNIPLPGWTAEIVPEIKH